MLSRVSVKNMQSILLSKIRSLMRNVLFERDLVFKSDIFRVTGGVAGGWYLRRGLGLLKFTLLLCFLKLAPEDLCFLVVIMTGTNELFTKSEGPSPVMYVLLLKVELKSL